MEMDLSRSAQGPGLLPLGARRRRNRRGAPGILLPHRLNVESYIRSVDGHDHYKIPTTDPSFYDQVEALPAAHLDLMISRNLLFTEQQVLAAPPPSLDPAGLDRARGKNRPLSLAKANSSHQQIKVRR